MSDRCLDCPYVHTTKVSQMVHLKHGGEQQKRSRLHNLFLLLLLLTTPGADPLALNRSSESNTFDVEPFDGALHKKDRRTVRKPKKRTKRG